MTDPKVKDDEELVKLYHDAMARGLTGVEFAREIGYTAYRSLWSRLRRIEKKTGQRVIVTGHGSAEARAKALKAPPPADAVHVYTSAQNNTPTNLKFFESLKSYQTARKATLGVIPLRYKNVSLYQTKSERDEPVWYPAELIPYLIEERQELNENLTLMAHVKVQATAVNPLGGAGFNTMSGSKSAIIGHPQMQMRMIPTPSMRVPKMLHTTGSVSMENYSQSKAGEVGRVHHTYGAVVVELVGDKFHIREIVSKERGEFYDLDYKYTPSGRERSERAEALVLGDLHEKALSPEVLRSTFLGTDSIVSRLRPRRIVLHDAFDMYAGSHHHKKQPVVEYQKYHHGDHGIQQELDSLVEFHNKYLYLEDTEIIYVDSNHHRHLERWLDEASPNADHENAILYHELRAAQLRVAKEGKEFDALAHYMRARINNAENVKWLRGDESYQVKGIELSLHGDVGPNGSRGSVSALTKIGCPAIVGHYHTPAIDKGVVAVGTSSTLQRDYTRGPSSWMNTHAIVYPNGAISLLHIIGPSWCG